MHQTHLHGGERVKIHAIIMYKFTELKQIYQNSSIVRALIPTIQTVCTLIVHTQQRQDNYQFG